MSSAHLFWSLRKFYVWILDSEFHLVFSSWKFSVDFEEIPGQRKARFPPLSIIALGFKGTRMYTSLYVVWVFGLVLVQFFREAKAYSTSPNCSRVSQYESIWNFEVVSVTSCPDCQNLPNKVALKQQQCWEQALGGPYFLEQRWQTMIFHQADGLSLRQSLTGMSADAISFPTHPKKTHLAPFRTLGTRTEYCSGLKS